MIKSIKKAFSYFVAMMTILSSVSFGSLGFANVAVAQAVSAGDLIKASGAAVYYYAANGTRYVFPNEKTYFTWYKDFSSVKTITDAELAAIQIGGNVTFRAGAQLVKITTDPKVYAVTPGGVLHWIESEAIATSLYGSAWASRVYDVPDPFFVNYTVGSSVSTAVHPDGQVVMYEGDANYYLVSNGQKRMFASQAALDANNIDTSFAIKTTISYPSGTDVAGYETLIADTVSTEAAPISGELSVSLASDTPAGQTVTINASSVKLAKYKLMVVSGSVTVNDLTIHRVGVGAAADFANVYLYNADGVRLTTGRTINSQTHTATFSNVGLMVSAGTPVYVYVYADFSSPSTTGGVHAFEIMDAGSVVVSGDVTVSGTFPVRGNSFTVGSSSSGRLDVQSGTTPPNPNVGAKNVEVSNFRLIANTNDIKVNSIILYQAGSVTNSDLTNFELYQGNTLVATADTVGTSGRITLNFNAPFLIPNGNTRIFSLRADVGGRSARTIRTYVEYTTDVNATDVVYDTGAAVCISASATGGCTSTSQGSFDGLSTDYVEVTTQGGTLTNSFNGPSTQNIAKGKQGITLYKFALTAENDLEIRNLRFAINNTAGTGCYVKGSAGTNYFRSIKVKNEDTGQTMMGPTELASGLANSSANSGTLTLSDTFNIDAGETMNLAITADLSASEDVTGEFYGSDDCGYTVTLGSSGAVFGSSDVRIVDTGEFLATSQIVPNGSVIGNQQNVRASSLTISLAGSPSSGTIVKKQAGVPVAGLVLSSGAQSDILVTSITLTCQAALAQSGNTFSSSGALAACDERITSLSLWDGDKQVGVARTPDTTLGTAQMSNMDLTIAAGGSKSLIVKATFSSTASTTAPYDQISVGIASTGNVSAQDGDANTVTPSLAASVTANATGASPSVIQTVRNSGTVTYNSDSHPVSTIVVAGKDVWVPFASYKATAQFESMELDRIAVLASSTAGNLADNSVFTAVAVAAGGVVKAQDILSSGTTGTRDMDLSSSKITVPKNGSVNFQLWAKLSSVQASSTVSGAVAGVHRSGMVPAMGLNSGVMTGEWNSSYFSSANIRATGLASGERVYASTTNAAHGNAMVTRQTKPIVTKQSLSSTTLANIDQDLIKFQVAADANGTVGLKQVVFALSKTSAVTLANFRVRKGSSDMALGDFAVVYSSSTGAASDVEAGTIAANQAAGYVTVSFTGEESISGSGNVYTLHATVSGAASGQNMSLSFYRDANSPIVTGYLDDSFAVSPLVSSASIFTIDVSAAPSSTPAGTFYAGTFLWSDMSGVPHSSALGTSAGSRDWTNDVYIEDVSQTQTLSL
ncbi:hypothetical protein KJ937_01110 [Patescibacteria group bacterium]|nr:hypothetical protein [Patescibacteria group bacterium]